MTRFPQANVVDDLVAVEEPLEIWVDGVPIAVLMRTPGHDLDLVRGFLFTEGIIDERADLAALQHCSDPGAEHPQNTVVARLAAGCVAPNRPSDAARRFVAPTGCGLCGKTQIAQVQQRVVTQPAPLPLPHAVVRFAAEHALTWQPGFAATGGLHAAAILRSTEPTEALFVAEDVGRHNAVDKVIGRRLAHDVAPGDDVMWLSGRASFDVVQKAGMAGCKALICVGAPTSLAVSLAEAIGLTLVGFAGGPQRFNVYVGSVTGH